eukprot:1189200-Prorocentrum_minimum.AAC.3
MRMSDTNRTLTRSSGRHLFEGCVVVVGVELGPPHADVEQLFLLVVVSSQASGALGWWLKVRQQCLVEDGGPHARGGVARDARHHRQALPRGGRKGVRPHARGGVARDARHHRQALPMGVGRSFSFLLFAPPRGGRRGVGPHARGGVARDAQHHRQALLRGEGRSFSFRYLDCPIFDRADDNPL